MGESGRVAARVACMCAAAASDCLVSVEPHNACDPHNRLAVCSRSISGALGRGSRGSLQRGILSPAEPNNTKKPAGALRPFVSCMHISLPAQEPAPKAAFGLPRVLRGASQAAGNCWILFSSSHRLKTAVAHAHQPLPALFYRSIDQTC